MLTQELNDLYTRVGPGTPCGELMRRYWHPITTVSQMKDHYTAPIRLLGEDLVLYKDRSGQVRTHSAAVRPSPHGHDLRHP